MIINENFTQQNNSTKIISDSLDPTEIYYSSSGNYIIYESINLLHIHPFDMKIPNSLGIIKEHTLPNTIKPNSKLSIDWIHDLIYWVRDSKMIVAAHTASLNKPIVIANKIYDSIRSLAINPIDSFIIWFEFDNYDNINFLYKASQDGSKRQIIFQKKASIKRLVIDYRSRRIFYLSTYELCSINYDGSDEQLVIPNSEEIYQFDILGDYVFWIEHSSNHLFRVDVNQTKKSLDFGHNINRFQIVHYWRQPDATNRCLNSICSDICLPVDTNHYRCGCHQPNCSENQSIQTILDLNQQLVSSPQIDITVSTTPQYNVSETTSSSYETDLKKNMTSLINTTDSISYQNLTSVTKLDGHQSQYNYTLNQSSSTHINNIELLSTQRTTINLSTIGTTIADIDQNMSKVLKFDPINKRNGTLEKRDQISSNITESAISVGELKEYVNMKISWYYLLISGTVILIFGICMGAILSTITIKLYGKRKWY